MKPKRLTLPVKYSMSSNSFRYFRYKGSFLPQCGKYHLNKSNLSEKAKNTPQRDVTFSLLVCESPLELPVVAYIKRQRKASISPNLNCSR